MSNIQLFTVIFVSGTVFFTFLFANGIKKLLAKKYTLLVIGLIFLALASGLRYIPNAIFAVRGEYGIPYWQNMLLTDICPMFALVMFLCMSCNNRFMSQAIAPIAVLGGAFTVYGQFAINGVEQENLINGIFYDYQIRLGDGAPHNFGYFFTHYLMLMAGLIVVVGMPRQNWRHMLAGGACFALFYAYVAIVQAATGVNFNVSGLTVYDWTYLVQNNVTDGEYATLQEFFNAAYPLTKALFFIISIALFLVINALWIGYSTYVTNKKLLALRRSFVIAAQT